MKFERDAIVKEGSELGMILQSGDVTFDVIWINGGTSRYRYSTGRDIHVATPFELEGEEGTIRSLKEEAAKAREERRIGAGIRRGQIWPSR